MYNKPQGLLLLLYQELTEYCCNHPVTTTSKLTLSTVSSIEVIYEAFGLRFLEHFMSMYTAISFRNLRYNLLKLDYTGIVKFQYEHS